MLQSLLRELKKATKHIHLEFYIFEDDAIGRLVRDALIDKAREGVEIRVIYDDVGCWNVPNRFFDEMRSAGIEVRSFLKVRFPLFTSKVNYRNHRKIVVIDGRIGFVGGMNLAVRYMRGPSCSVWLEQIVSWRSIDGQSEEEKGFSVAVILFFIYVIISTFEQLV